MYYVLQVINFIRPYIQSFLEWLPVAWNNAISFLGNCWDGIVKFMSPVIETAKTIWDNFVNFFIENGSTISSFWFTVWN